ncbi:4121_t:CDS:2 [Diversispora eburnea]|uniref:4121_t:CDS:1 n=1 Tax=Diversispora eburnea TaxID=1213867 RepID=A0A9N8YMH7_9GLOM|nr:4121_t:CDS:2 [Diversispora eburnea]
MNSNSDSWNILSNDENSSLLLVEYPGIEGLTFFQKGEVPKEVTALTILCVHTHNGDGNPSIVTEQEAFSISPVDNPIYYNIAPSDTVITGSEVQDSTNFSVSLTDNTLSPVINNTIRLRKRPRQESNNDDNSDEKRRKFLERNRIAASKCRQKKKAAMEDLMSKSDSLETDNNLLKTRVNELREELLSLKDQLLRHENCSCNIIQEYIVKYYRQQ